MFHKPVILYYDNGQEEKRRAIEKSICHMGISLVPVTPNHFPQTVGYLAKVKGFPAKKFSPLEVQAAISQDLMVLCNFTDQYLDTLLAGMKSGTIPYVSLKAVLTAQNCFWTFPQLFQELYEEHQDLHSQQE